VVSTAILIHGAHHGGWCWQRVARLLRKEGWEVYAPSLTGAGDRGHLLSEHVTLDTRVQDIVGLLEAEELDDVVVCAHSAGGMVANGVAERVGERISSLIMLDAWSPATESRYSASSPRRKASRPSSAWRSQVTAG
jgi:pimeloyl-ACP methyl ester carboxylesterase